MIHCNEHRLPPIYQRCKHISHNLSPSRYIEQRRAKHTHTACIGATYHMVAADWVCVSWPHSILSNGSLCQLASQTHSQQMHRNNKNPFRRTLLLLLLSSMLNRACVWNLYLCSFRSVDSVSFRSCAGLLFFSPTCILLVVIFNLSIYLQNLYINIAYRETYMYI